MIPVADPSGFFIAGLLVLIAWISAFGLAGLLLSLCCSGPRRYWQQRQFRGLLLVMTLLVLILPGMGLQWDMRRYQQEQQARLLALNPMLDQALKLGELELPAGSRLTLDTLEPLDWQNQPQPYGLQSVKYAELPTPQMVLGLQVTALDLPPRHYFSKMRLTVDQPLGGWTCAGGEWVEFAREIEAQYRPSEWRWRECLLASGNHSGGLEWPRLTQIRREDSAWHLIAPEDALIELDGLPLLGVQMRTNANGDRRESEGELANSLTVGDWLHAAGTRVRQQLGDWLFSPPRNAASVNSKTGQRIEHGKLLRQRIADGQLIEVEDNPWADRFVLE